MTDPTTTTTETTKRIYRTPKQKAAFFAEKAEHYLTALIKLGIPDCDLGETLADVDGAASLIKALPDNWKIRVPKAPVAKKRPVPGDLVVVKEKVLTEYPGVLLAGMKVVAATKKTATCVNIDGQTIILPKKHLEKKAAESKAAESKAAE